MAVAHHLRTAVGRVRSGLRTLRARRRPEGESTTTRLHELREQSNRLRSIDLAFEVSLGRVPSDTEREHWLARFDEGFMPWDVVSSLVAGEEVRAGPLERDEGVRGLVRAAYRHFLRRDAADEELAPWVDAIDAGSSPWTQLESIASSEEATRWRQVAERQRTRSVWLAFEVSLGRVPSDAELDQWLARFDEGFMPWDVVSSLVAGEEVRAGPEERDDALGEMVRAAYRCFLHREPAADEVSALVAEVASGVSPWALLESIASSEEARSDATLGSVSNAALANYALEPLYGRGLSPSELASWKYALDAGSVGRTEFLLQAMLGHVRHAAAQRDAVEPDSDPQELTMMGTDEVISPRIWRARAEEIAAEVVSDDALGDQSARRLRQDHVATGVPKVSVIASLYRGGRYIERFLEMIVSQTMGADVELIVIDANSPENEAATIEWYQETHPNIVYRRIDHRIGIYQAWNIGVGLARADYLTNANLDDLRAPDSLERQAEVLDRYPWVDVVYQDFLYTLDDSLDFDTIARFGFTSDLPIVTPGTLMRYNAPHNAPMWRKCLHDEVGAFDEFLQSAGDYDFWMRCAAAGKAFYKINDPHVAYFQNPTGMSTKPGGPGAEEALRLLRKHAPGLVSPLVFADDSEFRSELESLCGSPLDDVGPTTFYDLAQHALESCWRSAYPTSEEPTP